MRNDIQDILGLNDIDKKNVALGAHDQSLVHHDFDIELYDDLVGMSPVVMETIAEGKDKLATFENLSKDMFLSLFKYKPEMRERKEIAPSRRFNHDMISEFMDTEEFTNLRDKCKLNLLNSTMGTEVLHQRALTKIDDVIEERRNKQQNGENFEDILQKINDMAQKEQELKDGTEQGGPGDQPGSGSGSGESAGGNKPQGSLSPGQAKQLADEIERLSQELSQSPAAQEFKEELTQAVQSAAKDALYDVGEMSEFVDAWGIGGDSNNGARVTFDESREALERIRNSKELQGLTDIVGRFRVMANSALKDQSTGEGYSVKSVTVGDRIHRVLPSEKLLLLSETTNKLFYKKFNEKQLLEYEMTNSDREGKGPMVICLDVSGSMNDGVRSVWGRAVSLALLEVAQKQKRDFALIMFHNSIAQEWIIKKGELKPAVVLDIAEVYYSGGTNFGKPVKRALEIIEKEKAFNKADIVFITDGDCNMDSGQEEKLIKTKKDKNIYIQTILINVSNHYSIDGVESWSDKVVKVSDLAELGDGVAEDIFTSAIA